MTPNDLNRAMFAGLDHGLNKLGNDHQCRPLSWVLFPDGELQGLAYESDYTVAEIPAVLAAWAEALNLGPADPVAAGTVRYLGTIAGWRVAVWGIVDRSAYDAIDRDIHRDAS